MHGGAEGSGAPKGNQNALKSGDYTKRAIEERRELRRLIREADKFLEEFEILILYAIDFRPGDAGAKGIKLRQRALGELDLHAWRSLAAHSSHDGEPIPIPPLAFEYLILASFHKIETSLAKASWLRGPKYSPLVRTDILM